MGIILHGSCKGLLPSTGTQFSDSPCSGTFQAMATPLCKRGHIKPGFAAVSRALRLISENSIIDGGIEVLAERLGVGSRHLRRLFLQHLGATPTAVAKTRRLHFAKKLIDETTLPMTQFRQGKSRTLSAGAVWRSTFALLHCRADSLHVRSECRLGGYRARSNRSAFR
jgi:AraC-like DNA-binding protein